MMPQRQANKCISGHVLEKALQKATSTLGDGWDLEIIEALVTNYNIDFKDQSEESICEIETGLRDMLGSGADLIIKRYYDELQKVGYVF